MLRFENAPQFDKDLFDHIGVPGSIGMVLVAILVAGAVFVTSYRSGHIDWEIATGLSIIAAAVVIMPLAATASFITYDAHKSEIASYLNSSYGANVDTDGAGDLLRGEEIVISYDGKLTPVSLQEGPDGEAVVVRHFDREVLEPTTK